MAEARDGGARRYQLVVLGPDEIRTADLPAAGTVTIGRAVGSDIHIDDPSVSRHHARLHVGTVVTVEDMGAANGTMVRERPDPHVCSDTVNVRQLVGRRADLVVGDTLLFGTTTAVLRHAPSQDNPPLSDDVDGARFGVMVRDPAVRMLYQQALRVAATPISVLLLGETGVGKEVLARTIHARSARAQGPFMAINCAALADSLLESELFGHDKGAFTGAMQGRAGLFEAAAGGTVFLDEVGELSPAAQAKLLRVLEDRTVLRVGSTKARSLDVRFLAATHRDLEAEGAGGRFRQDLYYRLNGLTLTIPPLRERQQEIEPLAQAFLAASCRLIESDDVPGLSRAAVERLHAYPWPGNIRELRNAMERAAILCPGMIVLPEHLPPSIARLSTHAAQQVLEMKASEFPPTLVVSPEGTTGTKSLSRDRVIEALDKTAGSQTEAARLLGISRRTLVSRLEQYGLPRPRKRDLSAKL